MDMILTAVLLILSGSFLWVYQHIEEVVVTDPFITEETEKELWRINLMAAIFGGSCFTGAVWLLILIFMEIYNIR